MELNMNDKLTALELARRAGQRDSSLIIELMSMKNELLLDLPQTACNNGQTHEVLLRDSYPEAEAHGYNMGVGHKATQTRQVSEGLMMASVYSVVDKDLAESNGNAKSVRDSEAEAFVIGLGLQQARNIIYADKASNPYAINGMATRLKSLKNPHVVDAGIISGTLGTEPVTSIYLCALGTKQFHGIYSSTSSGFGVKREDKGEVQWDYGEGKKRPALLDLFSYQMGIAVEHQDSVYRICNVPVRAADWGADDNARKANRAKLMDLVLETQLKLPSEAGTTGIYCNMAAFGIIQKAGRDMDVHVHVDKDPWSNPVTIVNGMRMRRMDVIESSPEEQVA